METDRSAAGTETQPALPACLVGADGWLRERRKQVLLGLLALAVLFRVIYFLQLYSGPCPWLHQWNQTDMHFYDEVARMIAAGDLLLDKPVQPSAPYWMKDIAESYFKKFPEREEAYRKEAAESGMPDAGYALWAHWLGGKSFFQEPLYFYMVGFTYKIMGPDPRWVYAWQMLAGLGTLLLIHLVTRRLMGDLAALIATLAAQFYGPLMYYEMTLLRESLVAFTGIGLVYLIIVTLERQRLRDWTVLGAAFGVAMMVKSIFAVLVMGAGIHLVLSHRKSLATLWRPAGLFAAAMGVCLLPLAIRNVIVGVSPLKLTSVGPINVVLSNASGVAPHYATRAYAPVGQIVDVFAASDGKSLPTMVETLKTHESAWVLAYILGVKFFNIWHWYEIPNNLNFYLFQEYAPILKDLPVTFAMFAPWYFVSLALGWREFRRQWPLHLLVLLTVATMVAFGHCSRYRLPMIPAMLPLAVQGLFLTIRAFEAGKLARKLTLAVTLVGMLAWMSRPLPNVATLIRPVDHIAPYTAYYASRLMAASEAGDNATAVQILELVLEHEPAEVQAWNASNPALWPGDRRLAGHYAEVYGNYAHFLTLVGRPEDARLSQQRCDELRAAAKPGMPAIFSQ